MSKVNEQAVRRDVPATDDTDLGQFFDLSEMRPVTPSCVRPGGDWVYLSASWRYIGREEDPEQHLDLPWMHCGYYRTTHHLRQQIVDRGMLTSCGIYYKLLFLVDDDNKATVKLLACYDQICGHRLLSSVIRGDELAASWFHRRLAGVNYLGPLDSITDPTISQAGEPMAKVKPAAGPKQKQVSEEVRGVLVGLQWSERGAQIVGQLDRKLYRQVNDVLAACGGEWSSREKRHVFDVDGADQVYSVAESGYYLPPVDEQQFYQYFSTPPTVVDKMLTLINIQPGARRVLEPSAGDGRIALEAVRCGALVTCCELHDERRAILRKLNPSISVVDNPDFLSVVPTGDFDAVVMNPPFRAGQDIIHTLHAYEFLKPGGRLVGIVSGGVTFRSDKRTVAFRSWLDDNGCIVDELEPGTFKESGTQVKSLMVLVRRPGGC